MISSIFSIISSVWNRGSDENNPVGAEAIVTDYQERKMMVDEGKETTGMLINADRIVEEGIFQSNAVAQLWFDLGKYGQYPVTLSLPDGPEDTSEYEVFMDQLGYEPEDLRKIVESRISVPFIRTDGEWQLGWDDIEDNSQ